MSLNDLPDTTWNDDALLDETNAEFAAHEQALANHSEDLKAAQAELMNLAAGMNKSAAELDKENETLNVQSDARAAAVEAQLAGREDIDDLAYMRQLTLLSNAEWVGGSGPGQYLDRHPYTGGGSVNKHNEGGVTLGSYAYNLGANRLYAYAHARGDGVGTADDNDVTTYAHFNFWFLARRIGHVRAFVPYRASGYYDIYANDKWYNSKEAKLNLSLRVKLYQHGTSVATDTVSDTIFSVGDDNINRNDRVDRSGSVYSPSLAVGAERWARAVVQVRAHVETEGGGSRATLSFRNPDHVYIPYVRFDFS